MKINKLLLIILDGWGYREEIEGNAIRLAGTPNLDALKEVYPFTLLKCSGEAVGLPEGQMGNSEVGHLNIGAGRIVYQDLTRINRAIKDGSFFNNPVLKEAFAKARETGGKVHLLGLVSDGGVHSSLDHLFALLEFAKKEGLCDRVFLHAFTDGRDTPPKSALGYITQIKQKMEELGCGEIASVSGRFYAMDRDKRWERVAQAYYALVLGEALEVSDALQAVKEAYNRGETDEFIKPTVIVKNGKPLALIEDGDIVIFFNFRADRARELTRALTDPDFNEFDRKKWPKLAYYVCMTLYDETFDLPVAFPPEHLVNIWGEVISKASLYQFRTAETEKYAHVTYFFNGGEEKPFPLEERKLIPSPRDIATYDQKPEMSAYEVTEEVIKRIKSDKYSFIVMNYANGDMVGHTGVLEAAIKAVKVVDECVGKVLKVWREVTDNAPAIVTADHGNCEMMVDPETGGPFTAHTANPVPFYLVDDRFKNKKLYQGILADIAPTGLFLMGLEIPKEMTGNILLKL
ncbi:phosphoglycerate mutase, 2,3-bisphosphoglycerate-independent [Thermodesulfatator indicus DSM 15286]|uniref:2,3-bisphosphoglycerate-independent phosphoglycerate mutase n=1 Tax=Thermodesulfatator indicus (strain DSM 15286 / JCM 11887 / CIR29812) TaxID=667014 RepID=F8ADL1_THEID|nr:2,3-bisphosphoglycerate-independent phosphoglycerate mutase [Thermodesulfatator indicus]AEH44886.1 phosphoglycerate mutase, 2,3-bisphosphoglycerate-independent [Thermodesulfatator indicus DSM 15286]